MICIRPDEKMMKKARTLNLDRDHEKLAALSARFLVATKNDTLLQHCSSTERHKW